MNTKEINGYPVPSLDEVNQLFPEYEVQMLIGLGSSGAIYYATKDCLNVAIKLVVGPKNVRTQCEFRSEVEAMGAIEHPHIVAMYDHGKCKRSRIKAISR